MHSTRPLPDRYPPWEEGAGDREVGIVSAGEDRMLQVDRSAEGAAVA